MLKWSYSMITNQVKDLFQLQTELIDGKVDMAVSKAIDRVIDQIGGLRNEMHSMNHDMHKQFSSLERRSAIVEASLASIKETQKEIRNKTIEYSFKAGWFFL